LVAAAAGLALDDNLFANSQQRQENVDVDVVVRQVADIDLRGACLGCIVPKDVAVAGVSRRCASVRQEQE
jgi:hypothetical protein